MSSNNKEGTPGSRLGEDADAVFAGELETCRRHLRLHCYRMMGSLHEAEDLTQETMLRAWAARAKYEGRAPLRTWLVRIATNACLDALERRSTDSRVLDAGGLAPSTHMPASDPAAKVHWLEPVPATWIEQAPDPAADPEALLAMRQTVRLAFMAALQALPPRQRAAVLLKDVLGWSATEIADLLGTSVAAVNSALQRAREHLPLKLPAIVTAGEAELVERYIRAWEERSIDDLVALLSDDATLRMPPFQEWYRGRTNIRTFSVTAWEHYGRFIARQTQPSGQPAVLVYVADAGSGQPIPHSLHLLTFADDRIVEIVGYVGQLGKDLEPLFAS